MRLLIGALLATATSIAAAQEGPSLGPAPTGWVRIQRVSPGVTLPPHENLPEYFEEARRIGRGGSANLTCTVLKSHRLGRCTVERLAGFDVSAAVMAIADHAVVPGRSPAVGSRVTVWVAYLPEVYEEWSCRDEAGLAADCRLVRYYPEPFDAGPCMQWNPLDPENGYEGPVPSGAERQADGRVLIRNGRGLPIDVRICDAH